MDNQNQEAPFDATAYLNGPAVQRVAYLAERWEDEHEYEDWSEYEKDMRSMEQPPGVKVVRVSRRPFGYTFTAAGKRWRLRVGRRSIHVEELA